MSIFSDLGARVASILWRGREERELDEELRFHMDMEAERQRRAGAAPDAARRRGAIALGGVERTKPSCSRIVIASRTGVREMASSCDRRRSSRRISSGWE